jgi:hypothetical protein
MTLEKVLLGCVILSMLATVGVLFAGMISMARNTTQSVEGGRRSNRLMWWRIRLQVVAIVFILLWYLASRG